MTQAACTCGRLKSPDARQCRVCLAGLGAGSPLRRAMREAGMSVEELAARTGLSIRAVLYARAGFRVSPSTADAIAAVVDVDRAALVFAPRTRAAA